jgi:hypothetical protein
MGAWLARHPGGGIVRGRITRKLRGLLFSPGEEEAAAAWSPEEFEANLWAWDARDAASVRSGAAGVNQAASTELVSQWRDVSGNARHIAQATDANKPQLLVFGTLRELNFSGADRLDGSAALAQPYSVLAYVNATNDAVNQALTDSTVGASALYIDDAAGDKWSLYAGTAAVNGPANTGVLHSVAAVFDGAASKVSMDAGAQTTGNAGADGLTALRVGDNAAGTGGLVAAYVLELVIVSRVATTQEISDFHTYAVARHV